MLIYFFVVSHLLVMVTRQDLFREHFQVVTVNFFVNQMTITLALLLSIWLEHKLTDQLIQIN